MKNWNLTIGEINGSVTGAASLPTEANKIVTACVQELGKTLAKRLGPIGLKVADFLGVKFTFEGKTVNLPIGEFAPTHAVA
jgi:hypothetical protein